MLCQSYDLYNNLRGFDSEVRDDLYNLDRFIDHECNLNIAYILYCYSDIHVLFSTAGCYSEAGGGYSEAGGGYSEAAGCYSEAGGGYSEAGGGYLRAAVAISW